ncbi:MAG TPA: hypothetical protein VMW16_02060 [Sedimentisphaerales bacterium]|nr:hypothetical protein [Sedimentisphaerales bacterium]
MLKAFTTKSERFFSLCVVVLACSVGWASQKPNPNKYISIDEIRPGMEAYCLTVYKGTAIERFDLEVLDVVRNVMPGKNWILVQGKDERFIYTGPVGGCSGSPVYIDGRLAGALAYAPGWPFSKDPLYGVTPIEEMLRVGQEPPNTRQDSGGAGLVFDFSRPIDFTEFDRQLTDSQHRKLDSQGGIRRGASRFEQMPCPVITSGLPAEVVEQLDASIKPFGLMVVTGAGGGTSPGRNERIELVPGACLAVPLVTGDMTIDAVGTVTEVVGDEVYGFGHSFLGYGPIDLPMASGRVHTVVSRTLSSWKLATAGEIVGALTTDESTAVHGRIGAEAKMIPLAITVDRYNDTETRVYNCRLANNRLFTPILLRFAVAGAVLMLGGLPPDHMIEYSVTIGIEGSEPITFENVSTSQGLDEIMMESTVPVAILMNNPYRGVGIESVEMHVRIVPKNVASHIWSVGISDSRIKAGQEVEIAVVVESFLAEKKKYRGSLKIPGELAPGKYDLVVCGGYGYQQFLMKAAPHRFIPQNLPSLIEAINDILHIKRDRLYCLLLLPAGGVTLEKAELPDLPPTKALVLQDAKRTLMSQPYQRWIEKSFQTGTVIVDRKVMNIVVEKP